MSYKILPLVILGAFLFKGPKNMSLNNNSTQDSVKIQTKFLAENKIVKKESKALSFYNLINKGNYSLPNSEAFTKAYEGYEQLKSLGKISNEVLTIVDFSMSSKLERMWIIDMKTNTVMFQSLVSHGMNSGGEFAKNFSNENSSFKSSLGFYVTGETYIGKHGLSLKLDGQEYGVNHKARERAVVVHGADYASKNTIKTLGYLGRSQGCPAVPNENASKVINLIKNKSVLYIHHPSRVLISKTELAS